MAEFDIDQEKLPRPLEMPNLSRVPVLCAKAVYLVACLVCIHRFRQVKCRPTLYRNRHGGGGVGLTYTDLGAAIRLLLARHRKAVAPHFQADGQDRSQKTRRWFGLLIWISS